MIDTSEQFIKECNCSEVQQKAGKEGFDLNWYYSKRFGIERFQIPRLRFDPSDCIYLPREDEVVDWIWQAKGIKEWIDFENDFESWRRMWASLNTACHILPDEAMRQNFISRSHALIVWFKELVKGMR